MGNIKKCSYLKNSVHQNLENFAEVKTFMVLVRPSHHMSWQDVPGFSDANVTSPVTAIAGAVACEVGLAAEACGANQDCAPPNNKSRNGVCTCKKGFTREPDGKCVGAGEYIEFLLISEKTQHLDIKIVCLGRIARRKQYFLFLRLLCKASLFCFSMHDCNLQQSVSVLVRRPFF